MSVFRCSGAAAASGHHARMYALYSRASRSPPGRLQTSCQRPPPPAQSATAARQQACCREGRSQDAVSQSEAWLTRPTQPLELTAAAVTSTVLSHTAPNRSKE